MFSCRTALALHVHIVIFHSGLCWILVFKSEPGSSVIIYLLMLSKLEKNAECFC